MESYSREWVIPFVHIYVKQAPRVLQRMGVVIKWQNAPIRIVCARRNAKLYNYPLINGFRR